MNIITALANPKTNEKLKEKTELNIIGNDISYQEGILEMLEKDREIDLIIISELLDGNYTFKELIGKIKSIKNDVEIIVILKEKNDELKNYLFSQGIYEIFLNNKITIDELIKIINKKNKIIKENEINEEIKLIKEIILKNNKKINKNKFKNNYLLKLKNNKLINKKTIKNKIINNKLIKKIKYKKIKNNLLNKNKIISIVGTNGVGKSIFSSIFIKLIKNKKILLIDFDIFNKSINTNFGVSKSNKKIENYDKNNINNLIIKVNKNINLLCVTDMLFGGNYRINKNKTKEMLENFTNIYDLIIIDTTSECFFDFTKEILQKTDLIIFLVEPNITELKKSKNLLDIYINNWKIKKEKINIVFNKYNINSISNDILKILFSDFNILGKIKLNNKYNLIINNNLKKIDKKIKKEYLEIINKL